MISALELKVPMSLLAGRRESERGANFLAEAQPRIGPILSRAFDVFKKRTGRWPYEVARAHSMYSNEEIFPNPDPIDACELDGAHGCSVHVPYLAAGNVATSNSFAAWSKKSDKKPGPSGCTKHCYRGVGEDFGPSEACPLTSRFLQPEVEWTLERQQQLEQHAKLSMVPCQIGYLMRAPCKQVSLAPIGERRAQPDSP